jgi:hypothetical protein
MSRPLRDLTIEDLGELQALSSFKHGKLTIWNVRCAQGTVHQFKADSLTRKRYPVRSCGVCSRESYLDEAVYLPTHMQTFGWLLPVGHFRRGDIRELAIAHKLSRTPGKISPHPFWLCRCKGRGFGHTQCLGWVHRSTRGLRNMSEGCCTLCKPHYRLARLAEFERQAKWTEQRQEQGKEPFPIAESQRERLTRSSYHAAVHRVRRIPKYRRLGMFEGWKGPGGFEAFKAHIGLKLHGGLTLHRINNDIGYFPGNVEWTTKKKQAQERSTSHFLKVGGQMMNLSAFASMLNLKPSILSARINNYTGKGVPEDVAVEIIRSGMNKHNPSLGFDKPRLMSELA